MSLRDQWKYSRFRPKNTATHTRYRNWLSSRYWKRVNGGGPDKRPLPDRVSRAVTSRTPAYRDRVNPATGRPRWTDRSAADLARWQETRVRASGPAAAKDQEITMTTAPNSKTRKLSGRKILIASIILVLLGAIVTHRIFIAALIAAAALAALVFYARVRWTRYASGGWIAARKRRRYQGWAGFRDVRRVTRAACTLTRRLSPGTSLLILGTKGRARQRVAVCRENSALYVGPPGYGKTGALACHAADAPGALFATSTKTELLLDTLPYRAKLGGRIWILNADGYGNIPTTLAWSPLEGCASAMTAIRRAGDLIAASPRDTSGKDAWHEDRGARLLRYMLHAAAIAGASMYEVEAWVNDPASTEPMSILQAVDPGWADKLAALLADSGDNLGALVVIRVRRDRVDGRPGDGRRRLPPARRRLLRMGVRPLQRQRVPDRPEPPLRLPRPLLRRARR